MKKKGLFITFEGLDGSGKTTQMEILNDYLKKRGFNVVTTIEPGGTKIGRKIRKILLDKENHDISPLAETLLFLASRAELVSEVIAPALKEGKIVLCDRFFDSTVVYQGIARGLGEKEILKMNLWATGGVVPDITFLLSVKGSKEMNILENIDFLTEDNVNRSNIKLLSKMIESGNVSHAYLFNGNNTELLYRLALGFAASVNCPQKGCGNCIVCRNTIKGVYPNILIVEPEGNILRIEEIARLQKFMGLSSYIPGKKICIIKESELMNQAAGNRLLKTLEDPPDEDSIFLLLTEDIPVMLPTVVSRCLVYNWNFKFDKDALGKADFEIMDKYLDEGVKKILKGDPEKQSAAAMELTLRLVEILKKMEAAVKTDLEKDFVEIRRSDFEKRDINK